MAGSGPAGRYDVAAYAADLTAVQSALGVGPNAFGAIKAKIAGGASASLLILSDSTGSGVSTPKRWPRRLAEALVALVPTHSIVWHNVTSNAWDAAETLSTGTTSAYLHIWCCAIYGSVPRLVMGSLHLSLVRAIAADGVILNHGINMATYSATMTGEMVDAVEWCVRRWMPTTPISVILQNPNRDDDTIASVIANWRLVAPRLGVGLIDVYSDFVAAGKASALYADAVHPSDPDGNLIYLGRVLEHWTIAGAAPTLPRSSAYLTRGQNLLNNGGFTKGLSGGVPVGWAAVGTLTCAEDAAVYADYERGQSIRLTGSGSGQTYLRQDVTGGLLTALAGKNICASAIIRKDLSAPSTVGRLAVYYYAPSTGTVTLTCRSYGGSSLLQDGWVGWSLPDIKLPDDLTQLRAYLYHDTSSTPSTSYGVWVDQVSLCLGGLPCAGR